MSARVVNWTATSTTSEIWHENECMGLFQSLETDITKKMRLQPVADAVQSHLMELNQEQDALMRRWKTSGHPGNGN